MGGGRPVLSAWVAGKCNQVLRQELTEEEERLDPDLVRMATVRELGAWKQFKVFSAGKMGPQSRYAVDTRRVLTWKEEEGAKSEKA